MPRIIEVNGYDYSGKDYVIAGLKKTAQFEDAPRITALFLKDKNAEERVAFYSGLSQEQYADFQTRSHKAKNDTVLARKKEGVNIIVNRGHATVICDIAARQTMHGTSITASIDSALAQAEKNKFESISDETINLDLQGDIPEVMRKIEARKMKRDKTGFTEYESEHLPLFIRVYRIFIESSGGRMTWNEAQAQ